MEIFSFILALVFLLLLGGAGAVYAYIFMKQAQLDADLKNSEKPSESQVNLAHQVKELQKRIESLEAIVVDRDLELMTGLDSDLSIKSSIASRSDTDSLEINP